ncbi:UBX domain-containing protein 6-like [Branchiostoma floridae]|uniref:UBX domain-containing protein 6-like n=1 Tax=Branchiostoma floridae TaxID=7739 RepID=A0A9J7MXA1_BRAFL|nr:UBX domain-containing protein 6-like [Branchiostoma floridae]
MKKFFNKVKTEVTFKKAGEGHKLTEDTRTQAVQPRAPVERAHPSQGAQQAGAAALARLEQKDQSKNKRTSSAIRAVARAEAAEREREARSNANTHNAPAEPEVRDCAPVVLSVSGVRFICPLTEQSVPKERLDQHKRECIMTSLIDSPVIMAVTMIQSLNKGRDKVQVCVDTLRKYLENILANPQEEKFRKIRLSNKAFQDRVASMEGHEEFLQAAGFSLKELPHQDTVEPFWVLSEDKCEDLDSIKASVEVLTTTEPLKFKVDRMMQVLQPRDRVADFRLPDAFYNLSADEIKREQQERTDSVQKSFQLRTKAMREREEQQNLRRYNFTLIRVRFPDNMLLQGVFRAQEKLSALVQFVRDALVSDWLPFVLSSATGQRLEEEEVSFAELGLVPAAVVNFTWDPSIMADIAAQQGAASKNQYLKPELLL